MSCSKEIKKIPKHQLYKTNGSPYSSEIEGCGNEKMNEVGIRLPTRALCVKHRVSQSTSIDHQ